MNFHKGQQVWIISLDDHGCVEVSAAHVARSTAPNGTAQDGAVLVVYRQEREDGTGFPKIAERLKRDVFLDKKHALIVGGERSKATARRHAVRGEELFDAARGIV